MEQLPAQIGTPVDEIDTPALVVDLDAFERNLAKMARLARESGVRLRPHAKTHKSPAVALRQIAHGAIGQCVQKVAEAEVLVRGGVRDVLVSNEVFGAHKFRRLAALAREATVAVCFDAAEQVGPGQLGGDHHPHQHADHPVDHGGDREASRRSVKVCGGRHPRAR